MHNFNNVLKGFNKRATAVLTPEAMQAAIQPPMDPAAGGMPAGGAPMDPSAMGGAPAPMPGAAPAPGGAPAAQGSGGGEIPPEILQDQLFMQFLQAMGVIFDQQTGTFVDPNGQPLSVDEVMQIYDMFQQQVAAQQGAAPGGGAPADPAMGGAPMGGPVDPAAAGGMPADGAMPPEAAGMDPAMAGGAMGLPPEAAMGGVPAGDPAAMAAGGEPVDPMADPSAMGGAGGEEAVAENDPIMEIASAVMSGVEAMLQEFTDGLDEKIGKITKKLEDMQKAVDALQETRDNRKDEDKDEEASLEDELAAELQPTMAPAAVAPMPIDMGKAASVKTASVKPTNLYNFICKKS